MIYNGVNYDEPLAELSNKDLTGLDLSFRSDLNNKIIAFSCLSHEKPNSRCLPDNLTGAIFIMCNLDNVFVPNGNQVIDCSTRCFAAQQDGRDWILNPNTLEPISPLE